MLKKSTTLNYVIVALIIVTCLTSSSFADTTSSTTTDRGSRIERMLNLTDSQTAQLKPLLTSVRAQFKAIRDDSTLTPAQKKQKREALKRQVRAEIDQILTPAQQQELAGMRAQYRKEHGNKWQQPSN